MTRDDLDGMLWRTGASVRRTVFAVVGVVPGPGDVLIGMLDTAELAVAGVTAHNDQVRRALHERVGHEDR